MRARAIVGVGVLAAIGVAHADDDKLAKLLARTDVVAKEVAKARGLPLKRAIAKDVVDEAELRARLVKAAAEPKAAAALASEALQLGRWAELPRGLDFTALELDVLTEQIAGYYDPETRKLTISKSAVDDPEWAEMVLAHELDHALQDQAFDLHAFEDLPDTEGDAALARHALVEGDGIALMLEVMMGREKLPVPWSDPLVAATIEKSMALPGAGAASQLDKAPLAVREELMFPYRAGLGFVAALRRRQPWSAVDAAFRKPPRSTEQILHPERYLAGDEPIAVTAAVPPSLKGYAIASSTVWGEFGFGVFLRSHGIDDARAEQAAAGWGGDRAVVLTTGGSVDPAAAIGLVRLQWDSEADAIEATDAASYAVADACGGVIVEHTETRTRWLAPDGSAAWLERKGPALVLAIGVPQAAAATVITEAWTALRRR